ncbi:hypothetical protein TKK_0004545 [Trichogramma kaykai]|uniref:Uncharacterized protein n=1 Tax=Trichogramma kaykai TaxID=54128 RepID=A0ABD2XMJ7_9HYME
MKLNVSFALLALLFLTIATAMREVASQKQKGCASVRCRDNYECYEGKCYRRPTGVSCANIRCRGECRDYPPPSRCV